MADGQQPPSYAYNAAGLHSLFMLYKIEKCLDFSEHITLFEAVCSQTTTSWSAQRIFTEATASCEVYDVLIASYAMGLIKLTVKAQH